MITFLVHPLDSTTHPFDIGVLKKRLVQLEIIGTADGSGGHIEVYWVRLPPLVTQEPVARLVLLLPKSEALWGGLAGSFRPTRLVTALYAPFHLHHSGHGPLAQMIHDGVV